MGKWNNLKHIKRNFALVIVNLIILTILFIYIPVSTMVMFAMLPAVIYSIYTKRWFLILVSVAIYAGIIGIFFTIILNPALAAEVARTANLVVFLYTKLYPYEVDVGILHLLGVTLLFYLSLFVFFTLITSIILKISEFTAMITFSYTIMYFSVLYFLINVFSFLIPPLEAFFAYNLVMQHVFTFFYIIFPFLVINFSLLYIEMYVIDTIKRRDYKKEAKSLNDNKTKRERWLKGLAIVTVIIMTIIIIGGIIS